MTSRDESRNRLRRRVVQLTRTITFHAKTLIAVGGLVLIVLLQIPWLRSLLAKYGVNDPSQIGQAVIVALAVSIFFDVRSLLADENREAAEPAFFSDPMDVYPALLSKAAAIKKPEEKTLDIIGMTLYTSWPSVRFWVQRSELSGWTINMSSVFQLTRRASSHVPQSWYKDSNTNLKSIVEFSQSDAAAGNALNAFGYDFMPAIHGFRLGNGDLFWSALRWDADGRICLEGYTYEYVSGRDQSPLAKSKREVFDSWLRRSQQSKMELD